MRSSIGVTKIFTFYFILLYLFVKMKMCSTYSYKNNAFINNNTARIRHQHHHQHHQHHHQQHQQQQEQQHSHHSDIHKEPVQEAIQALKYGYPSINRLTNSDLKINNYHNHKNQQQSSYNQYHHTTKSPLINLNVRTRVNNYNNLRTSTINYNNFIRKPTSGAHSISVDKQPKSSLVSSNNNNNHFRKINTNSYYNKNYFDDLHTNLKSQSKTSNSLITKSLMTSKSKENNDLDYYYDDEEDDSTSNTQGDQYNSRDEIDNINADTYIPGSLTNHKFETLGNRDAVVKAHKATYTSRQRDPYNMKALAHASWIRKEGSCRWPKPKIISVTDDPSKRYIPHCTILHRCGDDSGCCDMSRQTCVAKNTASVELYFFVRTVGHADTSEILTFINHTECHCVDRMNQTNLLSNFEPNIQLTQAYDTCTCPKLFESVAKTNGPCRCDCSSSNHECDYLKKGKEHFSFDSRKCISDRKCEIPTCEYGVYRSRTGRCPRKDEKMSSGFLHI